MTLFYSLLIGYFTIILLDFMNESPGIVEAVRNVNELPIPCKNIKLCYVYFFFIYVNINNYFFFLLKITSINFRFFWGLFSVDCKFFYKINGLLKWNDS